ncbi:MAG: formylmethanofuran dehydrogenase [Candidatus Coatesbacteria bacterium]|nr:MAG: formylmethanofuran dehydrogenase [Candidatus Coatesbacteria bacterium]
MLFRKEIEDLIESGDLRGLLAKSAEFHGHICPYSVYGVKAGYIAVRELGIKNVGLEEMIAIVETNNCFSDGIQIVTGCTFGNNGLIYRDFGKTAVTVAKRDGTAIRIALKPEFDDAVANKYPEASALFEKIVVRREEVTEDEQTRMMQLYTEMGFELLEVSEDEMFIIERKTINVPAYAPVFSSRICAFCNERVMATRMKERDGKPACIPCANAEYYEMNGAGIKHVEGSKK